MWSELQRLNQTAARKLTRPPSDPGFGELGLILYSKLDEFRYGTFTPGNCHTFAHTGGNGVHFSFLALKGQVDEKCPVVVTNPAAGGLNFIVGENLYDFLCLGYYRGYFALEQLAYHYDLTVRVYTDPNWGATEEWHHSVGYDYRAGDSYRQDFGLGSSSVRVPPERQALLDLLINHFGLKPWTAPERFKELEREYAEVLAEPCEDL
jgi:hypothetical protein